MIFLRQGLRALHHSRGERRGLVARHKGGSINRVAIRADCQGPGTVRKHVDDGDETVSPRCHAGRQYPDIGPAQSGCQEIINREGRVVLPAERGRYERPLGFITGKNNIPGLIPNQDSVHNPRHTLQCHHTHRVAEVVYHPDFIIPRKRHGHRLQPHHHAAFQGHLVIIELVNFKAVGRAVRHRQPSAIG